MRWRNMRESDNVEDRQSQSPGGFGLGGVKIGGLGLVAVVVVSLLLGQNPLEILSMLAGDGAVTTAPAPGTSGAPGSPAVRDEGKEFVARIVGDTEDTWGRIFQQMGRRYEAPRLVLFRGRVNAAASIGDDRLQQQSLGTVRPESFTHGSSAQRARLFRAGFESGDPGQCDTFTAREP